MAQADIALPVGLPVAPSDISGNMRSTIVRLAQAINQAMRGNISATLTVTLAPGATYSTFSDSRIGPWTHIGLVPLTEHARAALPHISVAVSKGRATINHANSPSVDQTFLASLIGA